jgi:hypothetical protein
MKSFLLFILAAALALGVAAICTWIPNVDQSPFFIALIVIMIIAGIVSVVIGLID